MALDRSGRRAAYFNVDGLLNSIPNERIARFSDMQLQQLQLQVVHPPSNAEAVQALHDLVKTSLDPQQAQYLVSCGFHVQMLPAIPPLRQVENETEGAQLQILAFLLLYRIALASQSDEVVEEAILCSEKVRQVLTTLLDTYGSQSLQLVSLIMSLLVCFNVSSRPDAVYQKAVTAECLKSGEDESKRRLTLAIHEQMKLHAAQYGPIVVNYCELLKRSMCLDVAEELDKPLLLHELMMSLIDVYLTQRQVLIPILEVVEQWLLCLIDGDRAINGINMDPMPPVKSGFIASLVKVMSKNMDDPEVLIAACGVGNRMGRYDRIMGPVMKDNPLYPLGDEAIRRWRDTRPDVLEAGFRLILRCSLFQPTAQHIVRDGAFKHIFDGLRRYKHKLEYMSDGLMSMAHLSAPDSDPLKDYGGIDLLAELMELHKYDARTIGSGCIAISNLSMFPHHNIDLILQAGLHDLVVDRGLVLPMDLRFARAIVRAIMRFAGTTDPQLRLRVVHSRIPEVVRRICHQFAEEDEQQLHAITFSCVDSLTKSKEMKKLTMELGWHKKLTDLVDFEEDPPFSGRGRPLVNRQTREWVMEVLGRWAVSGEAAKKELYDIGAHIVIGKILRYHVRDPQLIVKCTQTLTHMSANGIYSSILARDGIIESMARTMYVNYSNGELHRVCLMCLASMGLGDKKIKQTMADAKMHRVALRCLQNQSHNAMPCMLSIILLLRMVLDDGVLTDIAELEGVQDTVLDAVSCRYSMTQCAGENDLVNCGHTLLSNIYCGIVWPSKRRRKRPPPEIKTMPGDTPIYQRRYNPDEKDIYELIVEDELNIQKESGDEVGPFTSSDSPIAIQRLSGMALHACPNCRKGLASELIMTVKDVMPADYEEFIKGGWFRRGGLQLFQFRQMHQYSCNTSEIRLKLSEFDETKSKTFMRVKKRADLAGVRIRTVRPRYSEDAFQLYYHYQIDRHETGFCAKESYYAHLLDTPLVGTEENGIAYGTFHQEYFVGDHLAGVGVIDVLPHALVSIYYFFDIDPKYAKLSLGVYSCLMEIEFARELNRRGANIEHYYLGNFCPDNKKLAYKADYQPAEVLCAHLSQEWQPHSEVQPSPFFKNPPPSAQAPTGQRKFGYSPHFIADLPGARHNGEPEICTGIYKKIRMCVEGEEMSADAMFRRYHVHPLSSRKFRLTLIDLEKSLSESLLHRVVVHVTLMDDILIYGDPMEIVRFGTRF